MWKRNFRLWRNIRSKTKTSITHTINLKINHSLGRNDSEGMAAAAAAASGPNYSKSNLKRKNEELKSEASMREAKERSTEWNSNQIKLCSDDSMSFHFNFPQSRATSNLYIVQTGACHDHYRNDDHTHSLCSYKCVMCVCVRELFFRQGIMIQSSPKRKKEVSVSVCAIKMNVRSE